MEKINNSELVPGDPEPPKTVEAMENPNEKMADASPHVVEGESAQRVEDLRQDILTTDDTGAKAKSPELKVPAPTIEKPPIGTGATVGGALGGAAGGFALFAGLLMLGISKGFSKLVSWFKDMAKGKGGGGGGGSHQSGSHKKAAAHAAPSGHASSGHKEGGGHGHH